MRMMPLSAFLCFFMLVACGFSESRVFASENKTTAGLNLVKKQQGSDKFGIKYSNVIEVDPKLFRIRTISAQKYSGKPRSNLLFLRERVPGMLAAINASFFDYASLKSIGLFIEDGEELSYIPHSSMNRILYVRKNGEADVVSGEDLYDADIVSAVAGKSKWPESVDSTSRSAVCVSKNGNVRLIAAYPVKTLEIMTEYLTTEENCVKTKIVHLDGGGSTQMYFDHGGKNLLIGWERQKSDGTPESEIRFQCYDAAVNFNSGCYRNVLNFIAIMPG